MDSTVNALRCVKSASLPRWYFPDHVHFVVLGQLEAVGDPRGHDDHDDLSRDGHRQFLLEALVHGFDAVQEDDAHQAHDESGDVGVGDVAEHGLDALTGGRRKTYVHKQRQRRGNPCNSAVTRTKI